MKTVRRIPFHVSALALALAILLPVKVPAQIQLQDVYVTSYDISAHATSNQRIEVTIVNPKPARVGVAGGNVEFEWKVEEGESIGIVPGLTTIAPGEARTFTLDPRVRTPRHVVVSFELRAEACDASTPPPSAGVSVETVSLTNGERRLLLLVPAVQAAREAQR